MTQKSRTQLLNALPDAVRSRVALLEDRLYISEEQRGILPVVNLTSAMRELGVTESTFVPASQFDAQYAMYASRIVHENEVVYTIRWRSHILPGMYVKDGDDLRKIVGTQEEGRHWRLHIRTVKTDAKDLTGDAQD